MTESKLPHTIDQALVAFEEVAYAAAFAGSAPPEEADRLMEQYAKARTLLADIVACCMATDRENTEKRLRAIGMS